MKSVANLAFLAMALTVAGCAGSKPLPQAPAPPISAIPEGFAETPMMRTSAGVEPATFNLEIGSAVRRGEAWVRDPGLVALRVSKAGEAPRVRLYRQDNHSEAPDSSTVTVIMDQLLDDAIAGIWAQYHLARGADGTWKVTSVRRAYKSRRGSDTELYLAEPAP